MKVKVLKRKIINTYWEQEYRMASAEYPQNVGARVPNGISRISPKCGSTSTEWHQQNIPNNGYGYLCIRQENISFNNSYVI
jgi:hypothetical protein